MEYPKCLVWYMALRWSLWYSEVAFVVCATSSIRENSTEIPSLRMDPAHGTRSVVLGAAWSLFWRTKQSSISPSKKNECSTGDLVSNLAWFGGEDVSHGHAGVAHADSRALK